MSGADQTREATRAGSGSAAGVESGGGGSVVTLAHGARLGRYLLLAEVGAGGMSMVYSGYDPELDRKVAIKLLLAAPSAAAAERLAREAHALARLNHPHVVHVYDVGELGDELFLVQELLEGGTLDAWLRERPRAWREVLEVLLAAGDGLAAAHEAGLIHRDVKPDNILFDRVGRVRLADFGLVVSAAEESQQPGRAGTPGYMSPEQQAGQPLDARSDQWAFCATLHEALFGARPGQAAPGAQPSRARVPAPVRRAVERGLAEAPADRFPSMRALLDELAAVPRRLRRRTGAATAAVVLLAAAGGLWALRRDPELCHGGRAQAAAIWSPARRAASRAAFLATRRPYAERFWTVAAARLDDWVRAYAAVHDEACAAVRLRRERSEAALDSQMACLEEQRTETAAVVDLIAHADGTVVDHAPEAADRAAALRSCADWRRLLESGRRPPPALAARIAAVRADVVTADALVEVGKPEAARAEAAAAAAAELGWQPLLADAYFVLGQSLQSDPRAEAVYLDALWAAERAGDDWTAARALIALVTRVHDEQEAARDASQAAALIERIGGDSSLTTQLRNAMARDHGLRGRYHLSLPLALASLGEALRPGTDPTSVAMARMLLAQVLANLGNLEAGEAGTREAIRLWEGELGTGTPNALLAREELARQLTNHGKIAEARRELEVVLAARQALGPDGVRDAAAVQRKIAETYDAEGDFPAALEHARAAEAYFAAAGEVEDDELSRVLELEANAFHGTGRVQKALATMTRVVELRLRRYGPDHLMVGYARMVLAEILLSAGQPERAIEEDAAARRILEPRYGARNPMLGNLYETDGEAYLELGKLEEARGQLEIARAIAQAAWGPDTPQQVMALTGLGRVALARHDPRAALPLLEQAAELARAEEIEPFDAGNAELALAEAERALGHRGRARELATSARDRLAAVGEKGARRLADAEALLRSL